jgi:hypothetical protein
MTTMPRRQGENDIFTKVYFEVNSTSDLKLGLTEASMPTCTWYVVMFNEKWHSVTCGKTFSVCYFPFTKPGSIYKYPIFCCNEAFKTK